jgi:hypothetical protein
MNATEGSYETKHRGYLNQWSLCCSFMVLKIGGQESCVCLFVILDPNILQEADNNLEAISEPDQLIKACAGYHVRKR